MNELLLTAALIFGWAAPLYGLWFFIKAVDRYHDSRHDLIEHRLSVLEAGRDQTNDQ